MTVSHHVDTVCVTLWGLHLKMFKTETFNNYVYFIIREKVRERGRERQEGKAQRE